MSKKHVTVDMESDPFLEVVEDEPTIEIKPIKIEKKVESNVYKEALETVLKMIQSGTHVENIMKYIYSILK
jgi:hypothetical protein